MEIKALREQKSVVILIRCSINKSIYWKYNVEKKKWAMALQHYLRSNKTEKCITFCKRSDVFFFNHQEVCICLKSGKK